jgi:O-antigen/teichoic acid export membrane protein
MALSLVAVVVLGLGADGRVLGASVAMVAAAIVAVALLLRFGDLRWACSRRDLADLLRFGGPLLPHALAGAMLALADRFTVGAKLGPEALGIYGAAAQLGMVMNMLGDTLVKTASPWMYAQLSRRSARGRLRVVALTYLLVPVWLAAAVVLWLVLSSIGSVVLGERYQAAISLSIWFLLGGAMSSIYLSIAGLFFFTARNEWLSAATVSSALITVGLALVLVDRYGLTGAAIAYLVGQLSQLVLSWLVSLRVQPMPWQRPQLALRLLTRPTSGVSA